MPIKIGPILTVYEPDYVPKLIDAILADNERGSHWLNNEAADRLRREWPTLLAMAELIEKERDELKDDLKQLTENQKDK